MDGELLSYTHPAKARKHLKSGKFKVYSKEPFIVQLTTREGNMPKRKKVTSITNFSEYFKNARDNYQDIYVQNISNAQISMSVPVGVNQIESITLPKTRKPYNLCQDVPFDALANSMDLRKLVNRRPEALRLITEEEYMKHYENLAKRNKTSANEEIDRALELKRTLAMKPRDQGPRPKTTEELALERSNASDEEEFLEEIKITPRIVGLCSQVGHGIEKQDMLKAADMLEELKEIEDELTSADFEYLMTNGHYKTVRNWVAQVQAKRATEEPEEYEE